MIRDPSDGSVKEINPEANEINAVAQKTAPKGIIPDTGIRQPQREKEQARYDWSREWLKSYFEEKRNARGNREQAAGDLQDRGGG